MGHSECEVFAPGAHFRVNMHGQHIFCECIPVVLKLDTSAWRRHEAATTGQSKLNNRTAEG